MSKEKTICKFSSFELIILLIKLGIKFFHVYSCKET